MSAIPIYPHLAGVNYESMVDGEGVRATIYLSGCSHHCPGCHNPETHDPKYGTRITNEVIELIADEIAKRPYLSGITLSGGDPFFNSCGTYAFLVDLLLALGRRNIDKINVCTYTGYTFEEIIKKDLFWDIMLLGFTDVLVDGPYIEALADKSLPFCGSSNQRIIDVPASLKKFIPVEYTLQPRGGITA